jgi:hypothetical protein
LAWRETSVDQREPFLDQRAALLQCGVREAALDHCVAFLDCTVDSAFAIRSPATAPSANIVCGGGK